MINAFDCIIYDYSETTADSNDAIFFAIDKCIKIILDDEEKLITHGVKIRRIPDYYYGELK